MTDLLFHKTTQASLQRSVSRPPHAVLLVGPTGSGKASTARYLAAGVLGLNETGLETYPYLSVIAPKEGKAIPIETIRELQHFMTLKIPGQRDLNRLVIIENAELLTREAQNALLKTLEEPPQGTMLILTATSTESLLPTIQSRVSVLQVVSPTSEQMKDYFSAQGYEAADIDKVLMVAGHLPGLTSSLLANEADHPLREATMQARQLLQSSSYERLLMVDGLSKQRELCLNIFSILGQMARMALMRSPDAVSKTNDRWQKVLKVSYEADEQLRHNTATKLVLMRLMLEL